MRPVLVSAWIAASLAWPAFGAQAQEASCDLMCRLQSYISTDHMAAPADGAGAAQTPHPAKRRAHAAVREAHPTTPVKSATAAPKPAKPIAQTKGPPVAEKAAKLDAIPKAAIVPKTETAPHSPNQHAVAVSVAKPAKRLAAASPPAPVASAAPATEATPKRTVRAAHAAARLARKKPASAPIAEVALIPGSARLVPADFQHFGKL